MDFISHFLWSYVLFGYLIHLPVHIGIILFFSVFPDISLIPFIYYEATHFRKYDIQKLHKVLPHYAEIGYHVTHSYVTAAAVSLMFLMISWKAALSVFIGWAVMHITIDLFIHKKGMQVMPLYPFSRATVKGVVTWYKSVWFMALDILLLIVIFTYMYLTGALF